MGDLFDEFKRELERRRAEAEGRGVDDGAGHPDHEDGADDEAAGSETPDGAGARQADEPDESDRPRDLSGLDSVPWAICSTSSSASWSGGARRPRAGA